MKLLNRRNKIRYENEPPTLYSGLITDEHIVGKWIDGKPIYEKILISENPDNVLNETTFISHNINNIDQCLYFDGFLARLNQGGTIQGSVRAPFLDITSSSTTVNGQLSLCFYIFDRENVGYTCGSTFKHGEYRYTHVIIYLRYTKTTD